MLRDVIQDSVLNQEIQRSLFEFFATGASPASSDANEKDREMYEAYMARRPEAGPIVPIQLDEHTCIALVWGINAVRNWPRTINVSTIVNEFEDGEIDRAIFALENYREWHNRRVELSIMDPKYRDVVSDKINEDAHLDVTASRLGSMLYDDTVRRCVIRPEAVNNDSAKEVDELRAKRNPELAKQLAMPKEYGDALREHAKMLGARARADRERRNRSH